MRAPHPRLDGLGAACLLRRPRGSSGPRGDREGDARRRWDILFLIVVVGLSVSTYITELGFYSDDWAFLGLLHTTDDRSLFGLMRHQFESDSQNLRLRPTQIVFQAVLYRLLGLEPLGYHVFNAALLATIAALSYVVLRELQVTRMLAVTLSAVFVMLPNYSTDRFWFAALGYGVSLGLYLLSLLSDLRAIRASGARRVGWILLALLSLLASGLGHETVLPLFLLNLWLAQIYARRRFSQGLSARLGHRGATLFVVAHLLVLVAVGVYKSQTAQFLGAMPGGPFLHLRRLVFGSLITNVGSYGLALPHSVWWGVRNVDPVVLAGGFGLAALVFTYVVRVADAQGGEVLDRRSRRAWITLCFAGVIVFVLGCSVFVTTGRVVFTSTGIGNRAAMVPSLGVAAALVGLTGLVSASMKTASRRRRCFAASIAGLCFSGFVITSALGDYWERAWDRERVILAEIDQRFPELEPGSTLVVHGICPYVGPAIVFESSWDLAGALQLRHNDPTLRADVTGRMAITDDSLVASVYGGWSSIYPYGHDLLLYDRENNTVVPLVDAGTALRHFGTTHPEIPERCSDGTPGRGQELLPADRFYRWLELRDFRP